MAHEKESPQPVGDDEARQRGVWSEHAEMPNGEFRFRLKAADGTAYIRTEASDSGGWQNSHYHHRVRETYIVQRGKMVLVEELPGGKLRIRLCGPDGIVTTEPPIPHNVYLFPNSIIHTVKHGEEGKEEDRIKYPALDTRTKPLCEADLLRLAERC